MILLRSLFAPLLSLSIVVLAVGDPAHAAERRPAASGAIFREMVLPPPDSAGTDGTRRFRIGALDKLDISVFGIEEITLKEIVVDNNGRITVPLVGEVVAAGRTTGELAREIELGLGRYVRDPNVTVNLHEVVSQVVTVDGQVDAPGIYPIGARMTLLQAIASAKGTTQFSRQSRVLIFRTVNGQKVAGLFNLKQIRNGAQTDPEVYADDVVVVGESATSRLLQNLIGIVPVVTTPLVILLTQGS